MSSRRNYDDMNRQLLPSDLSPRELGRHEDRSGSRHRRTSYSRSRSRSPASRGKKYGTSAAPSGRRPGYRSRSRERERDGGRNHGGGGGGGRGGGGRSRSKSPMSRRRDGGRNQGGGGGSRVIPENPSPNKCLGVFGLSLRTTERDLRDVFSRYGPIEECTVVIDAQTGRSRGFSFIYFESMEDAKAAKESCNGIEIDGRRIRVDFSITQRAHTPTPGIYMGKISHGMDRGYGYGRRGRRDDGNNRRRSPSPHYRRRARYSRSRSYSPRKYY